MIVLAIIAACAAAVLTVVVVFANGMSDLPGTPFQGRGLIIGSWILVAVLWLACWFN